MTGFNMSPREAVEVLAATHEEALRIIGELVEENLRLKEALAELRLVEIPNPPAHGLRPSVTAGESAKAQVAPTAWLLSSNENMLGRKDEP